MKGNLEDLRGVFAVPPLARRNDAARSMDFAENERIVKHISSGGLSRLIYGGNALGKVAEHSAERFVVKLR
jgi:hypothetical protein